MQARRHSSKSEHRIWLRKQRKVGVHRRWDIQGEAKGVRYTGRSYREMLVQGEKT